MSPVNDQSPDTSTFDFNRSMVSEKGNSKANKGIINFKGKYNLKCETTT